MNKERMVKGTLGAVGGAVAGGILGTVMGAMGDDFYCCWGDGVFTGREPHALHQLMKLFNVFALLALTTSFAAINPAQAQYS